MTRRIPARRLVTWLAPALLMGALALGACGTGSTSGTSTNTSTPDAATILKNAKAVTITDETYTMSLTTTAAGQTTTVTINGKSTKNPKREQLDMTAKASDTDLNYSLIEDGATNTDYVKFNAAGSLGVPTGQWFKVPGSTAEQLSSGIDTLLNFSTVTDAKLVGAEQIDGVAVWHLTATENSISTPTAGTATAAPETASGDLYFRQDNYYPVKMVVKTTGTDAATGTITWTAINSGISIALPKPSEVTTLPGA